MAIADLLVIIICVPLTSVLYTFESWQWGSALCRISEFAKDISIGVSVFTLTALSAERYCAIVNPLRKLQVNSRTHVMIWRLNKHFIAISIDFIDKVNDSFYSHYYMDSGSNMCDTSCYCFGSYSYFSSH